MADAYRVKSDVSLPQAIREVETLVNGEKVYETIGRNYAAGQIVLAREITPPLRERIENGDMDHLVEEVNLDDEAVQAELSAQGEFGVFIPEHEAERVVLEDYGHTPVDRSQVLEMQSAGADTAKEVLEASKEDDADARPNLTAREVPSLVEVSKGNAENVPVDPGAVIDDEVLEAHGVEMPPGTPTGPGKVAAEGGESAAPKRRSRPKKKDDGSTQGSEG